jgi:hypothetical protein
VTVTDVSTDTAELKLESAAFETPTTHGDPAIPGVSTPEFTEHVPLTKAKVTTPDPVPPDEASWRVDPYETVTDVSTIDA